MTKTFRYSWLVLFCLIVGLTGAVAQAVDNNLRVVFTPTDAGGEYGNRYVHAVWLTTPSGQWVCTVGNIEVNKRAVWADRRAYSLSSWWATNPDRSADVDARTGATQTAYKTYTIDWNWRTRDNTLIDDGEYLMHFECTNADSGNPRNYTTVAVSKSSDPWIVGPLTQGGYRDITLVHTRVELGTETLPATDVTERSAVLHGSIAHAEPRQKLSTWFYWGDNDGATDPAAWDYRVAVGKQGNGEFASVLDHLVENVTYYCRTAALDGAATLWGTQTVQFKAQATVTAFGEGDLWRYFEGRTDPGDGWTALGFDDDAWAEGPAGLGYGDGDDRTVVEMQGEYVTLYVRRHFEIESPNDVSSLAFTVTSPLSDNATVAPNETIDVTVQFHPTESGSAVYTKLLIASDDWDQPVVSIPLQGQGQ